MSKNKPLTAAELINSLNKDEAYQSRIKSRNTDLERHWHEIEIDERSIVAELNDIGYAIGSVWDLVNTDSSYFSAVPILLNHLSKKHHLKTLEGIARALISDEAKGYAQQLIDVYISIDDGNSQLKWLLGHAVGLAALEADVNQIIDLIRDEKNGLSREFLPIGLSVEKSRRIERFLKSIINDPCVGAAAKQVLSEFSKGRERNEDRTE